MRNCLVIVLFSLMAFTIIAKPTSWNCMGCDMKKVEPDGKLGDYCSKYSLEVYTRAGKTGNYSALLYRPQGVSTKKLPIVIYFPGKGEMGGDLSLVFRHPEFFDRVLSKDFQKRHPCFVMTISTPTDVPDLLYTSNDRLGSSAHQDLLFFIRGVIAVTDKQHVDRSRVYLTGFSYGADICSSLRGDYPHWFTASFLISATPDISSVQKDNPGKWWFVHNEHDKAYGNKERGWAKKFSQQITDAGGEVRFSTYAGTSHNAWTSAYKEDSIWDWLFSQQMESGGPDNVSWSAGARCTASVDCVADCGPDKAIDGLSATRFMTDRPARKGDWWLMELKNPVSGTIELGMGKDSCPARMEVSLDGQKFVKGKNVAGGGVCVFRTGEEFRFVRVRVTKDCDVPFCINSIQFKGRK